MKKIGLLLGLLIIVTFGFSKIWIVDKNGGGNYTTIQAAIGAATTGDTVRVWPGVYSDQLTLNKNIVLEGSGYENTIIAGNLDPMITVSDGLMKWFTVAAYYGNGINISKGAVKNCVIKNCNKSGIGYLGTSVTSVIANCILINNKSYGVWGNSSITAYNCIGKSNGTSYDFYGSTTYFTYLDGKMFGIGIGVINTDPLFVDEANGDYHLKPGSPCIDTGDPSLLLNDPDGTRGDMGYFGGPDCPTFPVITKISPTPNGTKVNIKAKAKANY